MEPYREEDASAYRLIARAIECIGAEYKNQPEIAKIAEAVGVSSSHLSRLFKKWAGITPKQFIQFLTLEYAKEQLRKSESVLNAALSSGLSGPGRLHDLFVTFEAVSPGEYKKKAPDLTVEYGFHPTPFGTCLIALTSRGICHLSFLDDSVSPEQSENLKELLHEWQGAGLRKNSGATGTVVSEIFSPDRGGSFHLLLKGTNFQINVWKALLSIPPGTLVSYQQLARIVGNPESHRAAASAAAVNPVALLIPCHRVIKKTGEIHRYRWGSIRKRAIILREAAQKY